MTDREELIADLARWFRNDVGRRLVRVFQVAEEMELDHAPIMQVICAEALSLSAHCYEGDRETFMQMARDAYAIAKTGELEQ